MVSSSDTTGWAMVFLPGHLRVGNNTLYLDTARWTVSSNLDTTGWAMIFLPSHYRVGNGILT